MKITLVSILVQDPVKAHQFYTEVLGFTTYLFQPEAYLAIVVSPEQPDGTALLLEPNHHPVTKKYQSDIYNLNFPVIVFGVDDIDKEYARLKQLGVVFRSEPEKTDYGTETVFEDTCGNLVKLHQK